MSRNYMFRSYVWIYVLASIKGDALSSATLSVSIEGLYQPVYWYLHSSRIYTNICAETLTDSAADSSCYAKPLSVGKKKKANFSSLLLFFQLLCWCLGHLVVGRFSLAHRLRVLVKSSCVLRRGFVASSSMQSTNYNSRLRYFGAHLFRLY